MVPDLSSEFPLNVSCCYYLLLLFYKWGYQGQGRKWISQGRILVNGKG